MLRACDNGVTMTDPASGHQTLERLGMFPLSAVLYPHAQIPLHIFEPRYRALTRDCLAGDSRFGVVLIERGAEVGGGDQRMAVGRAPSSPRRLHSPTAVGC